MTTLQELNRATLSRQMLLEREALAPAQAVKRLVGLQAQNTASPYIALWNRVERLDVGDLDAAFETRVLVKATLMRFTLHIVHSDDYGSFQEALAPTLWSRLNEKRFRDTGLSIDDVKKLLPELRAFASEPRTSAEIDQWLEVRLGIPAKAVWWALRSVGGMLHAPTGNTWSYGHRPSFVASQVDPLPGGPNAAASALVSLARRYLGGYGPASIADLSRFAMVQRSRVKSAFEDLGDELELTETSGGTQLYDLRGAPRPPGDTPAPPRLMAMWDNVMLAHTNRSRIIPEKYRKLVIRSNGDVLPTLLVDGYVAGVWRPTEVGIEASAFRELGAKAWTGLAVEADALFRLIRQREPNVYRRYDRWWTDLPTAEVRVLT